MPSPTESTFQQRQEVPEGEEDCGGQRQGEAEMGLGR